MGLSRKRSRKTRDAEADNDLNGSDFLENGKLAMEDEDEGYDVNSDDDEEEEEEEGPDEEIEGEEAEEEEEQNESHRAAEMEELDKEYMELRKQEQKILENLKRHKDEDLLKGRAVKNQKALWDKNLEFRFLLQKAFTSSNRLPKEPVRSSFCDSDEVVSAAYSELVASSQKTLESLLELQEALLENNPSITQSSSGNSGQYAKKWSKDSVDLDMGGDEDWLRISQTHGRVSSFRDKSMDKWQRMAQVTTGAAAIRGKLQAFNQNISEQVASYMRDPSKIVKQMQLRRSAVGVFGAVPELMGNPKGEEAHPDGDPELLDDSEFYQQLLKEFFETIDPTSSETAFYALKRLQTKKRKVVDRRASKSRKIRYNIHEKLVNFMTPQPMNLPPEAPMLFENLFGLKTQTC